MIYIKVLYIGLIVYTVFSISYVFKMIDKMYDKDNTTTIDEAIENNDLSIW